MMPEKTTTPGQNGISRMKKIEITYEEGSDYNSRPVAKIRGIALNTAERIIAEKVNEIIREINNNDKKGM